MGWFAVSRIMLLISNDTNSLNFETSKAQELGNQTLEDIGVVPYI